MLSPASVTRNATPGLSRLLVRKASGSSTFPFEAIFTVVVIKREGCANWRIRQ